MLFFAIKAKLSFVTNFSDFKNDESFFLNCCHSRIQIHNFICCNKNNKNNENDERKNETKLKRNNRNFEFRNRDDSDRNTKKTMFELLKLLVDDTINFNVLFENKKFYIVSNFSKN